MRVRHVVEAVAVLAGFAVLAPSAAQAQCDLDNLQLGTLNVGCQIQVGDLMREFDVDVPADLSNVDALGTNNHGLTSNKNDQRMVSALDGIVNEGKAVIILPMGIANSFNAKGDGMGRNNCCGNAVVQNVDDVGFIRMALAAVKTSLKLRDDIVIFSTGISNGMALGNRLTCEAGDLFDLIAGVSFQLPADLTPCAPKAGSIYTEFHGSNDQIVNIEGNPLLNAGPSREVFKNLGALRGCAATVTDTQVSSNTTCHALSGCQGGGLVQMCEVAGGTHVLYPNFAPDGPFPMLFEALLDQAIAAKKAGAPVANKLGIPGSMVPN